MLDRLGLTGAQAESEVPLALPRDAATDELVHQVFHGSSFVVVGEKGEVCSTGA
jgi:hypothetical protein